MVENAIIYQAYGIKAIIHETKYSLLSLLRVCTTQDLQNLMIVIYTDSMEEFSLFESAFPHFILKPIDQKIINEWRGEINFVHRVKIKVIQDFCAWHQGKFLYIDSDTYFLKNPLPIFEKIDHQMIPMHILEGSLKSKGVLMKKLNRFFSSFEFLINGVEQKLPSDVMMWNAGVIGLNTKDVYLVDAALEYTDIWHAAYPKHVMEQLAFSFVFQRARTVIPTDDYIYHYWSFKEFRTILAAFFAKYHAASLEELVAKSSNILPDVGAKDKLKYEKTNIFTKWVRKYKGQKWENKQII